MTARKGGEKGVVESKNRERREEKREVKESVKLKEGEGKRKGG